MTRSKPKPEGGDGGSGLTVAETARDHLRAMAGGLLVGLPLLWTMEVWDDGAVLEPAKLLVLLVIGFAVVVGFNALAGFRRDRTWAELFVDSVQSMGIGIVVAALALFVLGVLDPTQTAPTVGQVALESIPVAFGASLAGSVLSDPSDDDEGGPVGEDEPVTAIGRLLVAGAGSLYFALNIAPTDEVRILAASATPVQLVLVVLASLGIGLAIVFHAEFRGGQRARGSGPLDGALGETIAAYAVSLVVSLLLLWSFGSIDGMSARVVAAQVVLLGVVATFGAAAARLLVGSPSEGASE